MSFNTSKPVMYGRPHLWFSGYPPTHFIPAELILGMNAGIACRKASPLVWIAVLGGISTRRFPFSTNIISRQAMISGMDIFNDSTSHRDKYSIFSPRFSMSKVLLLQSGSRLFQAVYSTKISLGVLHQKLSASFSIMVFRLSNYSEYSLSVSNPHG